MVDPDRQHDVYRAPFIEFPDLRLRIVQLIDSLRTKQLDVLKYTDYTALLDAFGPNENIIDDALAMIEPEVLDLQGKIITPEL